MKQYLMFAGASYYPGGGWDDFIGSFDTIAECKDIWITDQLHNCDWYQIVDTTTMKEVKQDVQG